MSGLTSSDSYPNEPEPNIEQRRTPSPLDNQQTQRAPYPYHIDEAEDFYDPFSDLNLFLANKIKREIEEHGSVKKWSGKIESNLLSKILPDFKKKFPRYRLGASALKKVWEKVTYYYEKIQKQDGALQKDGKLNIGLMIKENLKSTINLPMNLPPHSFAYQIALNLSECIATLEGKRPELTQLTKVIWGVQKHMLPNLSPMETKSPFEEYNKVDKLIVKGLLEATANESHLSPSELKSAILKEFFHYKHAKKAAKNNQLTSTLSMILAKKLYPTSLISCHFALAEIKKIEAFIETQIAMSKHNETLISDSHRIELIQRLLALYAITKDLPKNLSDLQLQAGIQYVYALTLQKPYNHCPVLDQTALVFINAQIHLMGEAKFSLSLKEIEEAIITTYRSASDLPVLTPLQYEHFEILIWKLIEANDSLLSKMDPNAVELFETQVGNTLIDNPSQTFRQVIRASLQYFKKVLELPLDPKNSPDFWLNLEDKIEVWTAQNDMIYRSIHVDEEHTLFRLVQSEWKKHPNNDCHNAFINQLEKKALQMYSYLVPFKTQVRTRLWVFYKYFWYTSVSDSTTSTYERFLKWHEKNLGSSSLSLKEISETALPLIPTQDSSCA